MKEILRKDDGEDKNGREWVTDSDWVMNDDGGCNEDKYGSDLVKDSV
jgi:hypothetical protein